MKIILHRSSGCFLGNLCLGSWVFRVCFCVSFQDIPGFWSLRHPINLKNKSIQRYTHHIAAATIFKQGGAWVFRKSVSNSFLPHRVLQVGQKIHFWFHLTRALSCIFDMFPMVCCKTHTGPLYTFLSWLPCIMLPPSSHYLWNKKKCNVTWCEKHQSIWVHLQGNVGLLLQKSVLSLSSLWTGWGGVPTCNFMLPELVVPKDLFHWLDGLMVDVQQSFYST